MTEFFINMKRSFFEKILFYLSVPKCVGCGEKIDIDDFGLCKNCEEQFRIKSDRNCSRCSKRLNECSCSPKYLKDNHVSHLFKCFRYIINDENRPHNNLIFSLKKDNRSDVVKKLSTLLADSIQNFGNDISDFVITNVPRRKISIKKYGLDHSKELAKNVARILGLEYKSLLISRSKRQQKTLRGEERIHNAEFELKRKSVIKGKSIIIIDDIVTTGASMGRCAKILRKSGAKKILGACIAIAYKDEYTPPIKNYIKIF